MSTGRKATAELIGTFWLAFGGCGTAVLAAQHVGVLGVAIAFGLTVVTMAYAIGHISGCHLNPAVTVGLVVGGRFPAKELPAYVVAQVAGAVLAALLLMVIVKGAGEGALEAARDAGFASNGYGEHSPGGYDLMAALVTEVVLTLVFLFVILGATDGRASAGFAGLAIGLALTLIHLISIPVTNTSVNPARSTGPALIAGGWALEQSWLFWIAPLVGGALGGLLYEKVGRA